MKIRKSKKVIREEIETVGDISALINRLNDEFGKGTLVRASDVEGLPIEMIPTGIYPFDFATCGGIPKRKVSEFNGPYSSFKSTAAWKTLAQHQRLQPKHGLGVLCDMEHCADVAIPYAKKLGVDTDRLIIIDPDHGEQAHDVLKAVLSDDAFDILAIIDSLAALIPVNDLESSAEKAQAMGGNAKFITRVLASLNTRLKRGLYDRSLRPTTILALNQERNKIGIIFGSPITNPGGLAREHYMGIMARFHSSPAKVQYEEETRNGVKQKIAVTQEVSFAVRKNKVNGLYEEGSFTFYKRPAKGYQRFEFDNADSLIQYGCFHGVISRIGNTLTYGDLRAVGDKKFRTLLQEKGADLQNEIYELIIEKIRKDIYGE